MPWSKVRQANGAAFSAGWSEEAVASAVRLFSEAIALDPKFAGVGGTGRRAAGKLDQALAAAQEACRADAKFYPAQILLALVQTKLGNEAEAIKALAEARRIRSLICRSLQPRTRSSPAIIMPAAVAP